MCMDREQHRAAKAALVAAMNQGQDWHAAAAAAGLSTSRTAAYRLRRRVQLEGDAALEDGRHGHAYKLHAPARHWLVATCQAAPHTPSHVLQTALHAQFDVCLSIGYLNQLRATLDIRYVRPHRKKR